MDREGVKEPYSPPPCAVSLTAWRPFNVKGTIKKWHSAFHLEGVVLYYDLTFLINGISLEWRQTSLTYSHRPYANMSSQESWLTAAWQHQRWRIKKRNEKNEGFFVVTVLQTAGLELIKLRLLGLKYSEQMLTHRHLELLASCAIQLPHKREQRATVNNPLLQFQVQNNKASRSS